LKPRDCSRRIVGRGCALAGREHHKAATVQGNAEGGLIREAMARAEQTRQQIDGCLQRVSARPDLQQSAAQVAACPARIPDPGRIHKMGPPSLLHELTQVAALGLPVTQQGVQAHGRAWPLLSAPAADTSLGPPQRFGQGGPCTGRLGAAAPEAATSRRRVLRRGQDLPCVLGRSWPHRCTVISGAGGRTAPGRGQN
jgi:hypothetical protein